MTELQRQRLRARVRHHRWRLCQGVLLALAAYAFAWWALLGINGFDSAMPVVGPGAFFQVHRGVMYWGHADCKITLGWLFSNRSGDGLVTHPRITIRWIDWTLVQMLGYLIVIPALAIVLIKRSRALLAWKSLSRRRARIGICQSCGYDRAGLAAGAVCPECGAVTA